MGDDEFRMDLHLHDVRNQGGWGQLRATSSDRRFDLPFIADSSRASTVYRVELQRRARATYLEEGCPECIRKEGMQREVEVHGFGLLGA
jgi:hypothetical protein